MGQSGLASVGAVILTQYSHSCWDPMAMASMTAHPLVIKNEKKKENTLYKR